MHLQSADNYVRFDDVQSFVAEDSRGAFGLLAHHERFMTPLVYGLGQFRRKDHALQYVATVGGIAYFSENELYISTRYFIVEDDYNTISARLEHELVAAEYRTEASMKDESELKKRLKRQAVRKERAERERPTLLAQASFYSGLGLVCNKASRVMPKKIASCCNSKTFRRY